MKKSSGIIIKKMKSQVFRNLSNIPGWRSNRKVIVIESDDWGSIRMPSIDAFKKLESLGLDLRSFDAGRYNLNDTLASESDLENLFEVLSRHKDSAGKQVVFTPVTIVANPDFERILKENFNTYYLEPFTETLKKIPGCEGSFKLWIEGIEKRLFVPQMHGREHLNVTAWMNALRSGEEHTRLAFGEHVTGFVPLKYPEVDYQAAFLLWDPEELEYHKKVIIEGLGIFEDLFGYRAEYFVPPNGPFNNKLNQILVENGIRYRSTSKIQNEPAGYGKTRRVPHWIGQKDRSGLIYMTRNCFFEPNQPGKDWVNSCLNDIRTAFRWHKPAIISSHRVNYIGSLNPANRDSGLRQLDALLKEIIKCWPDMSFLTTPELGKLMAENNL